MGQPRVNLLNFQLKSWNKFIENNREEIWNLISNRSNVEGWKWKKLN